MAKRATTPGPKWTDELRKQLHGSRHPGPLDPPPPMRTREAGWASVLAAQVAMDKDSGPIQFADAGAKALYQPVLDTYAQPKATLDPLQERLRYDLLRMFQLGFPLEEAFVALWVGAHGLPFLFEVLLAPETWTLGSSGSERNMTVPAAAPDVYRWGRIDQEELWHALRRYCFALPELDFLAARDAAVAWSKTKAKSLAKDAQARLRIELSCALARDPALAHAEAERILSNPTENQLAHNHAGGRGLARLLSALTDLPLARRFVAAQAHLAEEVGPVALDLVESFERDAADLLQVFLDQVEKSLQSKRSKTFRARPLKVALRLALTDKRPPTP